MFLEVFSFQFCMFRKPLLAFPLMVFFLTLDDISLSSDSSTIIIINLRINQRKTAFMASSKSNNNDTKYQK